MQARLLWRAWRARYRDDRPELAAIRAALPRDGTAVDVGANRGSYLYWLARWAPAGRVVAFEPQDQLAAYLRAVISGQRWRHVTIEEAGVGDRPGELELHIPGGVVTPGASFSRRVAEREPCSHRIKQLVTLDDYFAPGTTIDVIKVDVEGLELQVFRGAERILRESAPLLVFECENRHLEEGSVSDVLSFLREHGYDGAFVRRGRLVPLARFDAGVHQREVGERFFKAKDYCNNFIMQRREPA
ncbi:MAG: FkbM family methyltransferase [Acidobacteriota bacterium]|jgi:FkbM family methyltransferase